jgi:glycine cleavage system H protein
VNIPTELRYTTEHEWIRAEGDLGTVGITDYAQDQLGDIVYLDLPATGSTLEQGRKLGEIESVKAVSDLYAPVSGEVIEVNEDAVDEPEAINNDPYGRGWLIRIRLSNPPQLDKLLTGEEYDEHITREMEENTD